MKTSIKKLYVLVAVAASLVVAGGVAYASVPSANGTISACKDSKGAIKIIDAEAGQTCSSTQQLLTWKTSGVSGYEIVTANSGQALSAPDKSVTAFCPGGKVAVGGGGAAGHVGSGGYITGPATDVALGSSGPQYGGLNGWSASATGIGPYADASWRLQAYAVCVSA
jgi:hypothetical protein